MTTYETKYYGPTNTKGSRIKVKSHRTQESKFFPFNCAANDPHRFALDQFLGDSDYSAYVTGSTPAGYFFTVKDIGD